MHTACLVSIGTELTLGQTVDTNSAWLATQLAALGVRTVRHITVGDDLAPIRDAIHLAAAAADVVVVTGGLGPTEDDLTREALAEALGQPLVSDAESARQIAEFFARRGRPMPEVNQRQALRPQLATALVNPVGTAPGIAAHVATRPCFCLPGVPSEMRHMFAREVTPRIAAEAGGRVLRSRVIRTFGMGESRVGELLADLMTRGRNPEVGTTAARGVIGVRINAEADSAVQADAILDEAEQTVRERLGQIVFGRDNDTLAGVAGRLLAERGHTVATVESCTGGLIGKELTDHAGSSAYFLGALVTYANSAKTALVGVPEAVLAEHGAVSEETAVGMAIGGRTRFGSDYGLAVTGIAGPGGGSAAKPVGLVYIAMADADGALAFEHRFGESATRATIRERAAQAALDHLRRRLLATAP